MTELGDTRADTRQQILLAASRQFARKPYSMVSLDDILADAQVTKGAMYFHFRSKQALAMAIIDELATSTRAAINQLLARRLSGLESLIDIAYLIAVQDLTDDITRAGLDLLESIGRADGFRAKVYQDWITAFAGVAQHGIDQDDIPGQLDPEEVSRLLVMLYAGARQIVRLDDADAFLTLLERTFIVCLPGYANADKVGYFTQFIRRRTSMAKHRVSFRHDSP